MKQMRHPNRPDQGGGLTSFLHQYFWHLLFYYSWVILYLLEIPMKMKKLWHIFLKNQLLFCHLLMIAQTIVINISLMG